MKIGIDLDGTAVTFGWSKTKPAINTGLIKELAEKTWRVTIITNQAGISLGIRSPRLFAEVIAELKTAMNMAGIVIDRILISLYHKDASEEDMIAVAQTLKALIPNCYPIIAPHMRKPSGAMLKVAGITHYYGDEETDRQAAEDAGATFVKVEKFLG